MTQHNLTLGQPYAGTARPYPEGLIYNVHDGQHHMALFLRRPTKEEIREFNEDPVRIASWWDHPVLWITAKVGDQPWSDATFNIALVQPPEARQQSALPTPTTRYVITMALVDAADGTTKTLRIATMSPSMSAHILDAISKQAQSGADPEQHERRINEVRQSLTSREIATIAGNEEILGLND